MTNEFFKSEVVQEELEDLQSTYTELLKMSQGFEDFNPQERLEHIEKTLELIAKQKVFYSRLQLMSNYVTEEDDDENEVKMIKDRIDAISSIYSGGNNLLSILQVMEDKLLGWRQEIQKGVDTP
jgi:hypothetical protein